MSIRLLVATLISLGVVTTPIQAVWTALDIRQRTDCVGSAVSRWTLCRLAAITQIDPSLGGPQALEGYTRTAQREGTVAMVLGTIGNVELSGGPASRTTYSAALAAGTVVSDAGLVDRAVGVTITAPARMGGYDGPIRVTRYDYIAFDRWSIRPLGAGGLQLCDPEDRCVNLADWIRRDGHVMSP